MGDDYFRCPACRAKLQFARRPKARVKCPRCGHQFDYQATPEGSGAVAKQPDTPGTHALPSVKATGEVEATKPPALDPFQHESSELDPFEPEPDDRDPSMSELSESDSSRPEFLEHELDSEFPVAELADFEPADGVDDLEADQPPLPLPVLPRKRKDAAGKRGGARPDSELEEEQQARKKKRKRKRRASNPQIWLACGGGAFLLVLVFVFFRFVLFGRSLTLDDVAGTYVSKKDPGQTITLGADGSCAIGSEGHGGSMHIGGFV